MHVEKSVFPISDHLKKHCRANWPICLQEFKIAYRRQFYLWNFIVCINVQYIYYNLSTVYLNYTYY